MLVLPSRLASVAEVDGFVEDLVADFGLNDDVRGNILISLTEAVTNGIRHGNGCDPDKYVRVDVWRRRASVRVRVTDEGPGFEPDAVPDPTCPSLREREGGRGVFLMRALADEISFHESGRAVEMVYECQHVEEHVSVGRVVAQA